LHPLKRNFFILLFAGIVLAAQPAALLATFYGQVQTGLQFIQENKKAGYFLYVPGSFSQERKWPLVLAFAEGGANGSNLKPYAEQWGGDAEKRGYVVLCPAWWNFRDSVPEQGDQMVFKILDKVIRDYPIDKSRILVTGFGDGADYAFYLALRYPDRFSAAAPVGGGITHVYENVISFRKVEGKPLAFWVLNGKQDVGLQDRQMTLEDVKQSVEKLRSSGLQVDYKEIAGLGHEYRKNFNKSILDWFEGIKGKP